MAGGTKGEVGVGGVLVQRRGLVIAGEGNSRGGSLLFYLNSEFPLLSGWRRIISAMPHCQYLDCIHPKVHVAKN
jgi:hypothetical protein